MAMSNRIKMMSKQEMDNIFEKCITIIAQKGFKVEHQQGLKELDKAGAQVDFNSRMVKFPRETVEWALKKVPQSFRLAHRSERPDIILPSPTGTFYVRNGSGPPNYLDPESNTYRDMTVAYVKECGQLIEVLDGIDLCAYPSPQDVPKQTTDVHALKALLESTTKHITVQPYTVDSIKYLFELGVAVAGSKEALKEKPIISLFPCAFVPLGVMEHDMEAVLQSCLHGTPIQIPSMPTTGANSPATIAGTTLQSCTEFLYMITIVQMLNPGNPVFCFPNIFTMDMRTGHPLQSTVESMLTSISILQVLKDVFHVPVNLYGFGTDSPIPDGQSMIETSLRSMLMFAAGSDILAGAGMVESYMGVSPVQMIIDNTLAGILRRIESGVDVNEETLAYEEILQTVPMTGNYLERAHTVKHCRDAILPELFIRCTAHTWRQDGSKDLYARTLERYRELKKQLKPVSLSKEVQKELDGIVKQADKELAK
ncbi:trimethylamine methyltransferase family protein [Chloroflexota bacterium]